MVNYEFDKERISQWLVKLGVQVNPPLSLDADRPRLQEYCNWLVEQFPEVFETLLSGPRQLQVQRTFMLPGGKRFELPTFVLAGRGPLFTFPRRIYLDQPNDLQIPDKQKVFIKALGQLLQTFDDRRIPRVGVINELVFDTGSIDSLQIVASTLKSDLWRRQARNLRIFLEAPQQGKNVNIELRPTFLRRVGQAGPVKPGEDIKFGIVANVDINNQKAGGPLSRADVNGLLAFADEYVPDELVKFLNSED